MAEEKTTSKIGIAGEVIQAAQGVIDLAKENLPDFKFDQAEIEIDADEEEFELRFTGTDFDIDNEGKFQGLTQKVVTDDRENTTTTNLWRWQLYVFADAGYINDEITIRGWVQHVYQPHEADTKKARKLDFQLIASADDATLKPNGAYGLKQSANEVGNRATHSEHADQLVRAELQATVTSTAGVDDITGYTFRLKVRHLSPGHNKTGKARRLKKSEPKARKKQDH